jgi:hypothetical protein
MTVQGRHIRLAARSVEPGNRPVGATHEEFNFFAVMPILIAANRVEFSPVNYGDYTAHRSWRARNSSEVC